MSGSNPNDPNAQAAMQQLLGSLNQAHSGAVNGMRDMGNVGALALGLNEPSPDRPYSGVLGALRSAGHDYGTYNNIRDWLLGGQDWTNRKMINANKGFMH